MEKQGYRNAFTKSHEEKLEKERIKDLIKRRILLHGAIQKV